MSDERWIIVPNWERFQTYGLGYRPRWIKTYTELLHKDEYVDLSLVARGLLHGIWLAYAERKGRLRVCDLSAALALGERQSYSRISLKALSDAGLIEFSSTKPLTLSLEVGTGRSSVPTSQALEKNSERELLRRALDLAADWQGGASETFDDAIDSLERELHAHLTQAQRSQLWDEALRRDRRSE